jgi:hypothetical protein
VKRSAPNEFRLASTDDFVSIEVLGYEFPDLDEGSDANWLECAVCVGVGEFRGEMKTGLYTWDFSKFLVELQICYHSLTGAAHLTTIEDTVSLAVEMDKTGSCRITGRLSDPGAAHTQLRFSFDADQTYLRRPLADLENLMRQFPIKEPREG